MGKPYSVKADLWSLGVIAYETVMGKVPFPAKTLPALQEMYRNSHKYDPFKNVSIYVSLFVCFYRWCNKPCFRLEQSCLVTA